MFLVTFLYDFILFCLTLIPLFLLFPSFWYDAAAVCGSCANAFGEDSIFCKNCGALRHRVITRCACGNKFLDDSRGFCRK